MSAETVRTILVVTLVSILVWFFAESRTLRVETLTIPVQIGAGSGSSVFRLTDAESWAGSVEVELAGPTGLIDAVRARALEGVTLEVGDELPGEAGTRSVELVDAIRRVGLFAESGLTVRRVSPRTLNMQVDRLASMTLPVEVDLEGLETAGPVTVEPSEVEVRLPASLEAVYAGQLHATAKIPPSRLSSLTPGRRTELSQVPIELQGLDDEAWGLRLNDPRVVVTLALRVRTQSLTLREIPVRLSVLPADLAVWSVEVPPEDRVLEDVVLTGPVSAIDQIRRGEVTPGAIAAIDLAGVDEEAAGTERSVPVRLLGLPSGVVADLGDRTIRVTLRKRAAVADDTPSE
jgi:hypothetical protein